MSKYTNVGFWNTQTCPVKEVSSFQGHRYRDSTVCMYTFASLPGQLEELLSYSEDFPEQLDKFLEPHDHIIWLHYVTTEDYPQVVYTGVIIIGRAGASTPIVYSI